MSDSTAEPCPEGQTRPRLILVEDDEAVRRSLQLLLAWRGFDVRSYASAASAIGHVGEDCRSEALVVDYRLPDGDGIGVLRALRRNGWSGRSVLITAFTSEALTDAALACGFDAVLEKPLRQQELMSALSL